MGNCNPDINTVGLIQFYLHITVDIQSTFQHLMEAGRQLIKMDAIDAKPEKSSQDVKPKLTGAEAALPDIQKLRISEDADYKHVYNMNYKNRGRFIIINNKNFVESPPRKGSDIDAGHLHDRFSELGFQVITHTDKTVSEMAAIIREEANPKLIDNSESDAFGCAVLSHGDRDVAYGSDNKTVDIDQLFAPLKNCASL